MNLPQGLYDLLVTEGLAARVDSARAEIQELHRGASEYLADVITRQLVAALDDVAGDDTTKARRQLELVNALLTAVRQRLATQEDAVQSADVIDLVAPPLRLLKAIQSDRQLPAPPEVGLAAPWLFTAGKGSPSLLQEIRRELASADQVDILVSFITLSGVRKLRDVFAAHHRHVGAGARHDTSSGPDHNLHRRDGGARTGRTGAPAGMRGTCVARWTAHSTTRQGLAVSPQDWLWVSLRWQRQPLGCGFDRRP